MNRILPLMLALALLSASADEAAIRRTLGERYPGIQVESVKTSPVAGVYEVWASGKLFYTDEKADYLFIGPLVETLTKTNLSQNRLTELRAVKFESLPLDKSIPIVKGKGERRLAVFSDPDCPYCKRLERELAKLDNLTVYLFLYPLEALHPNAVGVARNVWCSADRAKSWMDYMLDGKAPAAAAERCDPPIQEIAALASRLGIEGTPALVFPNGQRVDGLIPAERIETLLKGGS